MAMTNGTCVKSYMAPEAYNVVRTHAHKISGWKILSRLTHSHSPYLGGMNGDVRSDLSNLTFKNREQLEYLHIIILILQQEISSLDKFYLLQYLSSSA